MPDMQAAREAIDTLRPLCNSPAAQNALKTVEADVLGSDNSKGAGAKPSPFERNTPGAAAALTR